MNYIECIIQTGNPIVFLARMKQLNFLIRNETDEETGKPRKLWQRINAPCTLSMLEIPNGDFVFTARFTPEEMDRLPKQDTPNFEVIWASDEFDGEGNLLPLPLFNIEQPNYDADGNPYGTRIVQQSAPGLQ